MTDKEFYSLKICPNCKHNTIENAKLYNLEGKGECWTCGKEMKNFTRSELSKQKMKDFEVDKIKNCSNCNGIIKGGMRTKRCELCIKDKDFRYWEPAE